MKFLCQKIDFVIKQNRFCDNEINIDFVIALIHVITYVISQNHGMWKRICDFTKSNFCYHKLFVLRFYGSVYNEVMSSRSVNSGTVPGQA